MIVEGVPWAILLPVALMFLIWGVQTAKNELRANTKSAKTKKKN